MTTDSKRTSGIILLIIPTIVYGGYFLLTVISGQFEKPLTFFQTAMFRAGHAHAGVLVILALVAQLLADHASLNELWKKIARLSIPASAILVSAGFFFSAIHEGATAPSNLIWILYLGIGTLVVGVVTLGIGLLRSN